MTFLFVDSLAQNNSRFVQMIVKTVEVVLVSVGLMSTFSVMKEAVLPYSCHLVFSSFMGFLGCIRCFLSSPPTLILLLINLTVLLILASSALSAAPLHRHEITTLLDVDDESLALDHDHDLDLQINAHHHESPLAALPPPPPLPPPRDIVAEVITPPPPSSPPPSTRNYNQAMIIPQPQPQETIDFTTPSSLRSTEDEWKDVFIQNDDEDTMEATWKAISGGGEEKPKKKHLRKSETWDAPAPAPRRSSAVRRLDSEEVLPTSPKWKELRKAETFNDAVSVMRRGGMIRRDPSMSMEEFNQKVEGFIKNFNNNMKLERQESHQRYLDKINHTRL